MSEDFGNHRGIFDGGDERHRPPTLSHYGEWRRVAADVPLVQSDIMGMTSSIMLRELG